MIEFKNNETVKMTFENFNLTQLLKDADESSFKTRGADLYFFDPREELPIALGRMGDGWVCLIEDFLIGYFIDEYPDLDMDDFGVDDNDSVYYAEEDWTEGYFVQYFPETHEWQAQIDNGECGDSFEDLGKAIKEMECFLNK